MTYVNYSMRLSGSTSSILGKARFDRISRRLFKPLDLPRCFSIAFTLWYYSARILSPTLWLIWTLHASSIDRDLAHESKFSVLKVSQRHCWAAPCTAPPPKRSAQKDGIAELCTAPLLADSRHGNIARNGSTKGARESTRALDATLFPP